jgi:DNA segregation ATPase FtsK/SpoIIIE-like protein
MTGTPAWITSIKEQRAAEAAAASSRELDMLCDAAALVIDQQLVSPSMIQRKFRVNYVKAALLLTLLEDAGVIAGKDVLITPAQLPHVLARLRERG